MFGQSKASQRALKEPLRVFGYAGGGATFLNFAVALATGTA
jgi:hypothetical protein